MKRRGVALLAGLVILSALACDVVTQPPAGPTTGPPGTATLEGQRHSTLPPSPVPITTEGVTPELSPAAPPAPTHLNIPLRVHNPLDVACAGETFTFSVPLPSDLGLTDPYRLRLVDATGDPVPTRFVPLVHWSGAPDNAVALIHWVLVEFQATVGPRGTAYYFLQEGGPGHAPAPSLVVRATHDGTVTHTLHLPLALRDYAVPGPPAGLDVTLTVKNPLDTARTDEPVTSGVPIPRDVNLTDLGSLRLLNGSGQPVAAQFAPLARWGGSAGLTAGGSVGLTTGGAPGDTGRPVRWLLLDFQADVPADGTALYRLVDSGGASPSYPTLSVTDTASSVAVDVGSARFSISKVDGRLTGPHLDPLVGRAVDAGGTVYTTAGPVTVTVPFSGPMRVSVHVQGAYRDAGGTSLLHYTSRYWFHAGLPTVRFFHTVENNDLCPLAEYEQLDCYDIGSGGSVTVADLSLVLPTDLGGGLIYRAAGEGAPVTGGLTGDLLLYQDSSGTDYWDTFPTFTDWGGDLLDTRPRMQSYVTFRGYRTMLGGATVDDGDHAAGWLSVAGDDGAWAVGVRDFWQNFPKSLRARPDGTLEVGLFPDEFGPAGYGFVLRAGEHKTHEILLSHTPTLPHALHPLFAQAPVRWYVESGAFGPTALPNWTDGSTALAAGWPDHERYIVYQLTTSPDHDGWDDYFDNLLDAVERTDFYGIYDYGDWPIDYEGYEVAPLNAKYDNDHGLWLQWARTGDLRWFDLAEAADRHFADVDILHNRHVPRHWGDGIAFGHSSHEEDGFTNPHRNYGGTHPDTAFGMAGMLLTYYVTGYEKAFDSALELADCIEYRLRNDSHLCSYFLDCTGEGYGLGGSDGLYDAGSRPAANSLSVAVAAYRATGDPRYLVVADAVVDWARAEDQPYIDGPTGQGDDRMMRPWMLNLYLRALADYLEMRDEFGLPDTYDATGSFLAYADWLRTYAWINLSPIATGARAAYPYEWWFDGRAENADPSINNWLLLGADAMATAFRLSGDAGYLERAATLFRTGSRDPWYEGDPNIYAECKETINSITFGHRFLHEWAEGQ
jgi:hypothetical protein